MTRRTRSDGGNARRWGGPHSLWARGSQLLVVAATLLVPGRWVPADEAARSESMSLGVLVASAAGIGVAVWILHHRSRPREAMPTRTDDVSLVGASLTGGTTALIVCLALIGVRVPVLELTLRWLAGAFALLVARGIIRQLTTGHHPRRLLVIGTGDEAKETVELLRHHPEVDLEVIGVVGDRPTAERTGLNDHWLGGVEDLADILTTTAADVAVVTVTGFRGPTFTSILELLRSSEVESMLTIGIAYLDSGTLRVGSVVHESVLSIDWHRPGKVFRAAKRAMDIGGALIGLVLALPLFLVVYVAIKLDDGGPVFYRSTRIGRGRVEFGMLKFRSMGVGAHDQRNDLAQRNERSGPLFKITNDPRVTRVGRVLRDTSIDEIPQFWNVLCGEMSLVGPRPALPEEAEAFDARHGDRFILLPGVTGLWQVEARSNTNFSAYRRLDLHYLGNLSMRLDFEILVATFIQVVAVALTLPIRLGDKRRSDDSDGVEPAGVIDLRDRLLGEQAAPEIADTGVIRNG